MSVPERRRAGEDGDLGPTKVSYGRELPSFLQERKVKSFGVSRS